MKIQAFLLSDPDGVRTRVTAVKGRCPGPLDEGDVSGLNVPAITRGAYITGRQFPSQAYTNRILAYTLIQLANTVGFLCNSTHQILLFIKIDLSCKLHNLRYLCVNLMDSVQIIIIIAVAVVLITVFAVISSTIEKGKKEKQQALSKAQRQIKHYSSLVAYFPKEHLSKGLHIYTIQQLLNSYEQAIQIDKKSVNSDGLKKTQQCLQTALNGSGAPTVYNTITDATQLNNIKEVLPSLEKFINKLQQNKKIDAAKFAGFSAELQQLATQCHVDTCLLAAKKEEENKRESVALHYYQLLQDKVSQANMGPAFAEPVQLAQERSRQLNAEIERQKAEEERRLQAESSSSTATSDSWKKKQIYD